MSFQCMAACQLLIFSVAVANSASGQDAAKSGDKKADKKPTPIALAEGKLVLSIPGEWEQRKPANNIIDYEFAAPAAEGDSEGGRFTVSAAAGGVEANIARWVGQFASGAEAKRSKQKVGKAEIHVSDIRGTYLGPAFARTEKAKYRQLGAAIVTEKLGTYYIKFYGPEKTIAAQEKAFHKMLESLTER